MGNTDARALLRAERITRRITHPQASYTKDGKLLCNLCELPIKSENAWKAHLHSTGHLLRLSRLHNVDITRGNGSDHGGAKKRKADSLDSPVCDERKKAKPTDDEELTSTAQAQIIPSKATVPVVEPPVAADDRSLDDEYAAFERDMARLDSTSVVPSALHAVATVSAAPMSAAEIAAQAREQQSAQRDTRVLEIEGEREDAAKSMADELDEMDGLEERMKKLRERREALRSGTGHGNTHDPSGGDVDTGDGALTQPRGVEFDEDKGDDDNYDDDDDDDGADFEGWTFGGG